MCYIQKNSGSKLKLIEHIAAMCGCVSAIIRLIESLRMALSFHFPIICLWMKEIRCSAVCDRSVINFLPACISQIKSILQLFVFPVAIFYQIVIKSFHRKRQNYGRVSKIIQSKFTRNGKVRSTNMHIRWRAPYPFGIRFNWNEHCACLPRSLTWRWHTHTDCYVGLSYAGVVFNAFIWLKMWNSWRRRFHVPSYQIITAADGGQREASTYSLASMVIFSEFARCAYKEMRWNSNKTAREELWATRARCALPQSTKLPLNLIIYINTGWLFHSEHGWIWKKMYSSELSDARMPLPMSLTMANEFGKINIKITWEDASRIAHIVSPYLHLISINTVIYRFNYLQYCNFIDRQLNRECQQSEGKSTWLKNCARYVNWFHGSLRLNLNTAEKTKQKM